MGAGGARGRARDAGRGAVGDEGGGGRAETAEPRAAARTIDDDDDAGRD